MPDRLPLTGEDAPAAEKASTPIVGPGLPPCVKDPADFITTDCVQPPALK